MPLDQQLAIFHTLFHSSALTSKIFSPLTSEPSPPRLVRRSFRIRWTVASLLALQNFSASQIRAHGRALSFLLLQAKCLPTLIGLSCLPKILRAEPVAICNLNSTRHNLLSR